MEILYDTIVNRNKFVIMILLIPVLGTKKCSGEQKMISKTRFTGLLLIAIVCLFSMAACTSGENATAPIPNTGANNPVVVYVTQEAEVHNTSFTMMDGTKLELAPLTQLQVLSAPFSATDGSSTIFTLSEGQLLIVPAAGNNAQFTIQTQDGLTANLQGCAMAVSYSSTDNSFEMYCIGGACTFGAGTMHPVDAGKYMVYKDSIVQVLGDIDATAFKDKFHTDLPVCAPVPITGEQVTKTPTPVNDAAATATAACISFNQKFPSTPCP